MSLLCISHVPQMFSTQYVELLIVLFGVSCVQNGFHINDVFDLMICILNAYLNILFLVYDHNNKHVCETSGCDRLRWNYLLVMMK